MTVDRTTDGGARWGVLTFALLFPSVVTWAYFVLLADPEAPGLQQAAYSVGKCIQFGLPLVWVGLVLRRRISLRPPARGLVLGALFGVAVGGAVVAMYELWLGPSGFFDGPAEEIRKKVQGIGIDTKFKFIVLGVGYSAVHSFLEEYYWRWFVFGELQRRVSVLAAAAISGLGFAAHHVIVLATYFGWDNPVSYVFSLGVAVGGFVWALLYGRTRSLLGPWLSHAIVDAAIFTVGYLLVKSHLGG